MTQRPYLFVVVGTTNFNSLVKAVDHAEAIENYDGCMQIGNGTYEPSSLPFERFVPTLDPFYEKADLVIAHGGLAATVEVLRRGIPLISVCNPEVRDSHQDDLLGEFDRQGLLIWCKDLADLDECFERSINHRPTPYEEPECQIDEEISAFLDSHRQNKSKRPRILQRLMGRSDEVASQSPVPETRPVPETS